MKLRAVAVSAFHCLASRSSGASGFSLPVADIVAEVSIDSPERALVDRQQFDDAISLLVRARLIEAGGDDLRLTLEGDQFWRRIAHLQPSGVKRWIREAVDVYSQGEELGWAVSEHAWSHAQVLFCAHRRSRLIARLEVLDGFVAALDNWHFVSTLIGAVADRSAAVASLQGFPLHFSEAQAQHIVEMRLSQRTALGRLSLTEERDAIRAELEEVTQEGSPRGLERLLTPEWVSLEHFPVRSRAAG